MFDQAMEILEIGPDLQDVVLNADKKLSVQLRVRNIKQQIKTPGQHLNACRSSIGVEV